MRTLRHLRGGRGIQVAHHRAGRDGGPVPFRCNSRERGPCRFPGNLRRGHGQPAHDVRGKSARPGPADFGRGKRHIRDRLPGAGQDADLRFARPCCPGAFSARLARSHRRESDGSLRRPVPHREGGGGRGGERREGGHVAGDRVSAHGKLSNDKGASSFHHGPHRPCRLRERVLVGADDHLRKTQRHRHPQERRRR